MPALEGRIGERNSGSRGGKACALLFDRQSTLKQCATPERFRFEVRAKDSPGERIASSSIICSVLATQRTRSSGTRLRTFTNNWRIHFCLSARFRHTRRLKRKLRKPIKESLFCPSPVSVQLKTTSISLTP